MSSLLQSPGRTTRKGCEIFVFLQKEEPWIVGDLVTSRKVDSEPVELTRPNGSKSVVPKLYRIWRKPAGMFGCWVVFRINGKESVPDLSVPCGLFKLPRDAEELTEEEAKEYWFSSN